MSRLFIASLAGPHPNALSLWLQRHPGEPRIAWYPCAGMDYKDLLYLSDQFSRYEPAEQEDPPPPDLYLHSGCVDPKAIDPECDVLHESWGTRIVVIQRLLLPNIGLAGDPAAPYSGQAVFLQLQVESCTLGKWKVPLICAAVDHGAMAQRMVRHAQGRAKVSHCVLLMPKRRRLTEQNFPQRLVLRIADKIGLEMLITDRVQQEPLPPQHHAQPIPDLKTWSIVRARGTMAWSGNNCAQFLMRLPDDPILTNTLLNVTVQQANPEQDLPADPQAEHRAQPTTDLDREEPAMVAAQAGEVEPQPPWPLSISYEAVKAYFESVGRLRTLAKNQAWNRQQWPQGAGVYCIWRTPSNGPRQLLYIGKAGKFNRTGDAPVQLNDGCLASRLQRWTPYCFQSQGPFAEHFEYGPNGSVNKIPKMDYEARYREHLPAREIQVECFVLRGWEQQLSPALLEALLMQDYLQSHGDLPVANNEL